MSDELKIENGAPTSDASRQKRSTPKQTLPTERLSLERWQSSMRAYPVVFESNGGKPVTNEAAGAIVNLASTTIVMANAFLCDAKLLTRVKVDGLEEPGFIPSPELIAYHKAYEWNPSTAGEKLRPVFERMWFAEALLPRLKFRPYDVKEALTVLAEASGAGKEYEARLLTLLDLMVFVGVIARDGNSIRSVSVAKPLEKPVEAVAAAPAVQTPASPPVAEGHAEFPFILDAKRGRKVVVHAPIDMTQKEFERVRKWMEIQLVAEETPTT